MQCPTRPKSGGDLGAHVILNVEGLPIRPQVLRLPRRQIFEDFLRLGGKRFLPHFIDSQRWRPPSDGWLDCAFSCAPMRSVSIAQKP